MKKVIVIIFCLFFLVGCSNTDNTKQENKGKVSSEIKYFGFKIANLLNDLNNITLDNYELTSKKVEKSSESETESQSSSKNEKSNNQEEQSSSQSPIDVTEMNNNNILQLNTEDIDWSNLKNEIEIMNSSWTITMLDLSNLNVPNEEIQGFSNILNQTIISIKNENKAETLINLGNLYSYLPRFLATVSDKKYEQDIESTKYYILTSYILVSQGDWSLATTNLSNAENTFLNVLNNTEYTKDKEFKVNRTYMFIKELANATSSNDISLYFLKYKTLMESINTL